MQSALSINALFPVGVALAALMHWGFAQHAPGLVVRMAGDSRERAKALGYSVNGVRIAATTAGGSSRASAARRCRCTTRAAGTKAVQRPGPDRGGAGDLRALEPGALPRRGAAVRRRRRDRSRAASVGISCGYYLFSAVPYALTLVILVISCRPGSVARGSPGELSSVK